MINCQNLGKQYRGQWVFRNLCLKISAGESWVLLGPSGSGKSLLLKLIAGLIQPDEGQITLGNPNIGMLFQKNALFDSLTLEENLLFPLKERLKTEGQPAKEKVRWFLQEVGLQGCESLYPDEISGGMQKRLGIARALIVEPEILLYDEPTAGLDPITSRTIADLIQRLRKMRGTTLITVTNDIQRAYQLGDRICLLALGRLSPGETPQTLQASSDPAIRQFIYGLKEGPLSAG
ncbi:MAG: ABC transporter ATP-binding protein [Bdellovibrionia bacterium]